MRIVLASKSPRRREILSMVLKDFDIRVSSASEDYENDTPKEQVPRLLAERKALAVEMGEDEIVIGSDTVVIYDGEIMGKPKDEAEAVRMLKKLSGTAHSVVSGLCVRSKDKVYSTYVTTEVVFRHLTNEEISTYVNNYHPTDKAGAYGIQEMAGAFVKELHGDFYNVVGLPLCTLCEILRDEFSINIY